MGGLRVAIAAALLLASASAAQASGQWYVSGGYDYFSDGFNGGDINGGWKVNRYYAVELGITAGAATVKDDVGDNVSVAIAELTLDGYGFLPLDHNDRIALFGTAGLASVGVAASDSYNSGSAKGGGARAGAGIDFGLTRDMHLRVTGRYQIISVSSVNGGGRISGHDETVSAQLAYFF